MEMIDYDKNLKRTQCYRIKDMICIINSMYDHAKLKERQGKCDLNMVSKLIEKVTPIIGWLEIK